MEKKLAAISGSQVRVVERAFHAMRNDCLIEVVQSPKPLVLLAALAASGDFLVIVRTRDAGYGRVRPTIGMEHMCSLLGKLMRQGTSSALLIYKRTTQSIGVLMAMVADMCSQIE